MQATVADLLRRAEDRVPFFDWHLFPPPVALRLLEDVCRDLGADLAREVPDALLATATVTVPGTIATTPATLPVRTHVYDASAVLLNGDVMEVHVHPPAYRRLFPRHYLAVAEDSAGLWFFGRQEDWTQVTSVAVRYGPVQPAFTASTDQPLLPDTAQQAVTLGLAVLLIDRMIAAGAVGAEQASPALQRVTADRDSAVQRFLATAREASGPETMPTVEVW